jgi:hypothetical protein
MSSSSIPWTKSELQIYILLLCANADSDQTPEELDAIKAKVDQQTFDKMYAEFTGDTQDEALKKIDHKIQLLEYSHLELTALRREMYDIFFSDCDFKMMERNLDRILDNILY